jgi:nitrite reductase/ring-hydroxylating ferredoxin subunit
MKNLVIFLLLSALLSCKKKDKPVNAAEHPVPYVPVRVVIYPNDPLNFNLQAIGGWMYKDGGINGFIVYRKSEEEFVALERTSPHLPDNPAAKAFVMNDNFTLRDTVSGSKWRIFDGSVVQGPTTWALRLYATNYDGNSLWITN